MRVLLANRDLEYLGGTQVFIRSMYKHLSSIADVDVYTHHGNTLFPELTPFDPSKDYDVAFINHFPAFRDLTKASIGTRVLTSQGVFPAEEWPSLGADAYVGCSQAIVDHLPYRATVIRNPIDPDDYAKMSDISRTLKRVVYVSNRQDMALPIIQDACERAEVELRVVGGKSQTFDMKGAYNWGDLVIATARAACEAMSCGRNVMLFDYLGGYGTVTAENFDELDYSMFGGHAEGAHWGVQDVLDQFKLYDPDRDLRPRLMALYSPEVVVPMYLAVAKAAQERSWYSIPRLVAKGVCHGPHALSTTRITTFLSKRTPWLASHVLT